MKKTVKNAFKNVKIVFYIYGLLLFYIHVTNH